MLIDGRADIRSLDEQRTNPYPENIITCCFYDVEADWVDVSIVGNEYLADGSMYLVKDINSSDDVYACQIVEKQEDGNLIVRMLHLDDLIDTPVVLKNYPVTSVTFRMKRTLHVQNIPGLFRHHIEIDDGMFPSQWKDGYSSVKSEL